jgi:hypothetical protein
VPRESSGGYTKMPPISKAKPDPATTSVTPTEVRAAVVPMDGVFVPNQAQRLARARVLTASRNDPLLRPSNMSNEQLAKLTRMPTQCRNWLALDGFKEWLVASTDTEERVEFLLSTWLDEMGARIDRLSDKDLINAGKLLAEISTKQATRAAQQAPALDTMSTEQLKKLVGEALSGS